MREDWREFLLRRLKGGAGLCRSVWCDSSDCSSSSSSSFGFTFGLQAEGGQDVLLAGRALVAWRWAEVRLPVGADVIVVVVIVVVVQSVQQRRGAALTPGRHTVLQFWLGCCLFSRLFFFACLPDLTLQGLELALQLLVGLLLLIQVSLQLLLAVLQSVDLFLGLVHLPFQGLQTQIQL